ncbi:MAG: hypothetical protein AAFX87_15080 [Bacteroidota bacterium]
MGLDSVELVIAFEKAFGVDIPDTQAEQMYAIEDAVSIITQLINVQLEEPELQNQILDRVNDTLIALGLVSSPQSLSTLLSEIIPKDQRKEHWRNLEKQLILQLPKLTKVDLKEEKSTKAILGVNWAQSAQPFLNQNMSRLIDCIASLNYKKLVDPKKIKSAYEVQAVVMGITSFTCGVDIKDIYPESRFVYDLGID